MLNGRSAASFGASAPLRLWCSPVNINIWTTRWVGTFQHTPTLDLSVGTATVVAPYPHLRLRCLVCRCRRTYDMIVPACAGLSSGLFSRGVKAILKVEHVTTEPCDSHSSHTRHIITFRTRTPSPGMPLGPALFTPATLPCFSRLPLAVVVFSFVCRIFGCISIPIQGLGFNAPLALISLTYLIMHLASLSIRRVLIDNDNDIGLVDEEGAGNRGALVQQLSWHQWAWKVFPVAAASGLEVRAALRGPRRGCTHTHTRHNSTRDFVCESVVK